MEGGSEGGREGEIQREVEGCKQMSGECGINTQAYMTDRRVETEA